MAKDPLAAPGRLRKIATEYSKTKKAVTDFGKHAKTLNEELKAYVQRAGHRDSAGNYWVELDDVVEIPGMRKFNAVKNERHPDDTIDDDVAWEILEERKLKSSLLFDTVHVLNIEKLDEALAKKKITYDEYNRIVKTGERFHLVLAFVE